MSPSGRILDERYLDDLARFGPVSRTLSWLIRPAFVAEPGHSFVWGDWSAIEARMLPWLAGSRGAQRTLDIFKTNDADPSLPDIYVMTACELEGLDPIEWWGHYQDKTSKHHKAAKKLRQAQGKVPVLSLGFGGGLGALQNMATNYGVYMDDAAGDRMVKAWRETNPWARAFWDALWEAATSAVEKPGAIFTAGRVAYTYEPDYLGGSLFCALPSGRLLTYPAIKWEKRPVLEKGTKKPILDGDGEPDTSWQLTYRKGWGRSALWYGKCAENVTQAEAGSLLREKLVVFEKDVGDWLPVVGHTHDEIVGEVEEDGVGDALATVKEIMAENSDWNEGLPLAVDVKASWYYTKALD
jgi:DNA polymerase